MIVNPHDWQSVGTPVTTLAIKQTVLTVLSGTPTTNLALSGGLDSSLLLYYLTLIHPINTIRTYTIALSKSHPDYIYAQSVARFFGVKWKAYVPPCSLIKNIDDFPGDEIVKAFFGFLNHADVSSIICCDGIDEFMCGYYDHSNDPSESMYYSYLRRLQKEHFVPLDKNSGNVKVYLPYIDPRLIFLYAQIPLSEKCDECSRKKIMIELADENIPSDIIARRKYGFCDAMRIKR